MKRLIIVGLLLMTSCTTLGVRRDVYEAPKCYAVTTQSGDVKLLCDVKLIEAKGERTK